jgi:hypothetical protein
MVVSSVFIFDDDGIVVSSSLNGRLRVIRLSER